jgi:hypothetical protein
MIHKPMRIKPHPYLQEKKLQVLQSLAQPVRPQASLIARQRSLGNQATQRLSKAGVIQTKLAINRPGDQYEQEADRVAEQVMPISASPAGAIQRQGKPKTSFSGERSGTKEGKDKFSFKAEVTVPLTAGLKFGPVSFLDELKLTGTGGVTGEALGASSAELEDLKLQLALTLAKLQLATTKDKAEELRRGKVSLGATLSGLGSQTFAFDPFDPQGSLGASLALKSAAITPSLLPSSRGDLTISPSLSATGSVTQELGAEGKTIPKAEGKVGLEAAFKSPAFAGLTLGGALGEEAQVTAGLEAGASGSITPEKTSGKLTAGGSVGLAGKGKGVERFVKIQITGDIGLDREAGSATATTKSIFLGLTTGFKF